MASTNRLKWKDSENQLTAYCDDDSGETEIGPAHWDDTNNKLEINCNSTDFQVKWDDAGNTLEAQSVDDDCCIEYVESSCCDPDGTPRYLRIAFTNITDDCDDCSFASSYILEWVSGCAWVGGEGGGIGEIYIHVDVATSYDCYFIAQCRYDDTPPVGYSGWYCYFMGNLVTGIGCSWPRTVYNTGGPCPDACDDICGSGGYATLTAI